jgi:hypothetical protein
MAPIKTENIDEKNDGNCLDLAFVLTKVATKDVAIEDDTIEGCCMKADNCCSKTDTPKTVMSKIQGEKDINNVLEGGVCNCASWCTSCGGYCSWCSC